MWGHLGYYLLQKPSKCGMELGCFPCKGRQVAAQKMERRNKTLGIQVRSSLRHAHSTTDKGNMIMSREPNRSLSESHFGLHFDMPFNYSKGWYDDAKKTQQESLGIQLWSSLRHTHWTFSKLQEKSLYTRRNIDLCISIANIHALSWSGVSMGGILHKSTSTCIWLFHVSQCMSHAQKWKERCQWSSQSCWKLCSKLPIYMYVSSLGQG